MTEVVTDLVGELVEIHDRVYVDSTTDVYYRLNIRGRVRAVQVSRDQVMVLWIERVDDYRGIYADAAWKVGDIVRVACESDSGYSIIRVIK